MSLLDIFKPSDPELVEKTLARLNEQDKWNDVFSTKLIEILDNIDKIKAEIRDRLRSADERIQRAESVTQAESTLLEKATEFGDASNRLQRAQAAEERAMSAALCAEADLNKATTTLAAARETTERARILADDANGKLLAARDSESKAARSAQFTARSATLAVALSWIVIVWLGWFIRSARSTLWVAICLSFIIAASAAVLVRKVGYDSRKS